MSSALLPNRCSVAVKGKQCPSPPSKVVSLVSKDGQYMIGVSCDVHSEVFISHVKRLQQDGKLDVGSVKLEPLNAVGTDCIRGDADDLVRIDSDNHMS